MTSQTFIYFLRSWPLGIVQYEFVDVVSTKTKRNFIGNIDVVEQIQYYVISWLQLRSQSCTVDFLTNHLFHAV